MSDLIDLVVTGFGAFFIVLAVILLARYRQASQSISESSEHSSDLWKALQERLRKQDERIVDMMSKVEVLQARVLAPTAQVPPIPVTLRDVIPPQWAVQQKQVAEPRLVSLAKGELGDTEMTVIELLGAGSKSTIDIKEEIGLSREHTARTMKELFDRGLVARDDSAKPFIYQLTEKGKNLLSRG
jgi:CRP-like cAMP-binding protein